MISPILDRVLVQAIGDPPKIGSGLLYRAESYEERADQGIVKYIGPDVKDVVPGDYVCFAGYTGTSIVMEDEGTLICLPESMIMMKLHPPATNISGLYHRDADGNYFPATYESAVKLIRDQYWQMPRFANLKDRKAQDG